MRDAATTPARNLEPLFAVLALAMAPAIALGIGRFAYALVLPGMQHSFGWSYAQAGIPNGLNAFGYFVGAVTASRVAARVGSLRLVVFGAVAAALATLLSAFAIGIVSLSVLRFIAGVAGGFALVAGGICAIAIAQDAGKRAPFVVSTLYVGPPTGIIVSALVAPTALAFADGEAWRMAQLALGLISLAMLGAFLTPALRRARSLASPAVRVRAPLTPMALVLLGYGAFGAGYIVYMTFMIAYLRDGGGGLFEQAAFWCTIGVAGVVSPFLWRKAFERLTGGRAVAVTAAVTTAGAAITLFSLSLPALFLSALTFGIAQFAVTAATTVFVRRNFASAGWASAIGAMTVSFSLGQTVGPMLAGTVTDHFGGLQAGLGVGVALLVAGVLLSALQTDLAAAPAAISAERAV